MFYLVNRNLGQEAVQGRRYAYVTPLIRMITMRAWLLRNQATQNDSYKYIVIRHVKRDLISGLVVLGFNATLRAKVISWRLVHGFLTPVDLLTQLSFKSHRLLFSLASAEVRGEYTPKIQFASTGYQANNHQVMSPTRSLEPLGRGQLNTEGIYGTHM